MLKMVKMFSICFLIFCFSQSLAAETNYPQKISLITKSQANYLTPENCLAALNSSLMTKDLVWADEVMTQESLKEEIQLFQNAGIDRNKNFDLQKSIKEEFIVDKILYEDAVILVTETHLNDGSIQRIPITFIQENGLWKQTNKFAADPVLLKHLDATQAGF